MIYTVTFNPSLDYFVSVPDFKLGRTNRTESELLLPGGKGINVSILLKNLGIDSAALGFCAGFTGEEILRRLHEAGIRTDFIRLSEGCSRINLKLQNMEGTEINGMGPSVGRKKTEELMERLDSLKNGDVLVLAGSIPSSMPGGVYSQILCRLRDKGILTVVDAAGELLLDVLAYHPFLIKPNHHELGELFSAKLCSRESVIPYAEKLQELGARNVLVSLAGEGAVLVCEDRSVWMAEAPEGTLVNGVGAGDSMVAGFLAGWLQTGILQEAFRMGVAAGSASAFSRYLADREMILQVREQVAAVRWK